MLSVWNIVVFKLMSNEVVFVQAFHDGKTSVIRLLLLLARERKCTSCDAIN